MTWRERKYPRFPAPLGPIVHPHGNERGNEGGKNSRQLGREPVHRLQSQTQLKPNRRLLHVAKSLDFRLHPQKSGDFAPDHRHHLLPREFVQNDVSRGYQRTAHQRVHRPQPVISRGFGGGDDETKKGGKKEDVLALAGNLAGEREERETDGGSVVVEVEFEGRLEGRSWRESWREVEEGRIEEGRGEVAEKAGNRWRETMAGKRRSELVEEEASSRGESASGAESEEEERFDGAGIPAVMGGEGLEGKHAELFGLEGSHAKILAREDDELVESVIPAGGDG